MNFYYISIHEASDVFIELNNNVICLLSQSSSGPTDKLCFFSSAKDIMSVEDHNCTSPCAKLAKLSIKELIKTRSYYCKESAASFKPVITIYLAICNTISYQKASAKLQEYFVVEIYKEISKRSYILWYKFTSECFTWSLIVPLLVNLLQKLCH